MERSTEQKRQMPSATPTTLDARAFAPKGAIPHAGSPEQKSSRKRAAVIAIICALAAIAIWLLVWLFACNGASLFDPNAQDGQAPYKSAEEMQAELDRVVEEGMFNISIASVIELDHGSAPAELRIENVPGNRYLMRVTIMRNDTGEQIYATDLIEPDHHIQRDALDVVLPAGSYECTALFEALDEASEEPVGQAAAIVTLNVLS